MNMDSKTRFSSRVDNYAKYRPGYPPEIIDFLGSEEILTPDKVVADIGSGTGFLTKLFLQNGNFTYGVEPNADMRAAGEAYLSEFANFQSVDGAAENTTLEDKSVDIITAGQAFHWFDLEPTRTEFVRILKPGGHVVLIWNDRKTVDDPFGEAYESLIQTYATDCAGSGARKEMEWFFAPEQAHVAMFPNVQFLDYDSLKGRLLSASYIPMEGPRFDEMLAELEGIFIRNQHDGIVAMNYETTMYYGRLEP
jgi:SAM-dependent methyltransferase